jgi:hypothetical protein
VLRNPTSESGLFRLRVLLAFSLCLIGGLLATLAFVPAKPTTAPKRGPMLAFLKTDLSAGHQFGAIASSRTISVPAVTSSSSITFGHPIISGIGGFGYEENLRLDPTDPTRIYTSVPGSAAADTSWIWRSLDTGKTFKWVPAATPLEGKVASIAPCNGGGDTELGVDSAGHLYFNDLAALVNFSVSRSDDHGVTFTCNNIGVPDAGVDRQWYAIDGDPTSGGTLYLTNDEVGPGGVNCGNGVAGSAGNNVLVMYRSPAGGVGATAGLAFGPANKITADASCDEGIMGNDEISPVATRTGQPNGLGGYTQLPSPVKHVYVIHDNAALNQIRIARCFPVAFGAPVANVSDPSGLNCTDLLVKDLGSNGRTGANFPTMAIDKSGNLYAVWEQASTDANGNVIGDTVLMYSHSTNEGNSWSRPIQIDTSGSADGVLHNNVFAWIAAGDDGRVNIAWYGTPGLSNPNDPTCGQTAQVPPTPPSRNINGPDSTTGAVWSLWFAQSLNAHDVNPTFTAPIRASSHHNHVGTIQTLLGGQCGDRQGLGDFLQLRTGAQGEAQISYADSNNISHTLMSHAMFVRQDSGTGLIAGFSPVNIAGLKPFNGVSDPSGDAKYEAGGLSSANMPQLDILASSVSIATTPPCSAAAPCYQVTMQLNNLSLAGAVAPDTDTDLVWLTQWFVPSTTDPTGGRNFHVYAESFNGGALQCFTGQNAAATNGGGFSMAYPGGLTALPAANCQSTLGPNGTITIYVPLSMVSEPDPVDNRLHEVTASTMTLTQPANTNPDLIGSGVAGSLFNLIDVAQGYVFDPNLVGAVSRKVHGGAGTFDIDLLPPSPGIECRSPGQTGTTGVDYKVVFTFVNNIAVNGCGTTSTPGGAVASGPDANQCTVNLTGPPNHAYTTITLDGVTDVVGNTGPVSTVMGLLIGDVNTSKRTDNGDAIPIRNQSGSIPNSTTFRSDLNCSGRIDNGDAIIVRDNSGTVLPPP